MESALFKLAYSFENTFLSEILVIRSVIIHVFRSKNRLIYKNRFYFLFYVFEYVLVAALAHVDYDFIITNYHCK